MPLPGAATRRADYIGWGSNFRTLQTADFGHGDSVASVEFRPTLLETSGTVQEVCQHASCAVSLPHVCQVANICRRRMCKHCLPGECCHQTRQEAKGHSGIVSGFVLQDPGGDTLESQILKRRSTSGLVPVWGIVTDTHTGMSRPSAPSQVSAKGDPGMPLHCMVACKKEVQDAL
jgi:hypothetical protein